MKNFDRFKTADERDSAFRKFCGKRECESCDLDVSDKFWCTFAWLELEAEEDEILPCPFCGGEVVVGYTTNIHKEDFRQVWCKDIERCGYYCEKRKSADEAIAAHNRVAKAVMAAMEKEVEND